MVKLIFFKKYLNKYKINIALILILNICLWISNIITTYITGNYIDSLIKNINIIEVYKFSIIFILLTLFNILIGYLNNIIYPKLQANMVFDINFEVIKHVKKLPISFFNKIDPVYLNQRINGDSNEVTNFIISLIIKVTTQCISFIIVFCILTKKNIFLSIFVLSNIPLYLLLYKVFEKKLYETTLDYKEKQNKFISYMNRQLSNLSYVKLNSLFNILDNELLLEYPIFLNSIIKFFKNNYNFSSLTSILNSSFNVFLFFYGGICIYKKQMTVGDFIIIKSYYLMLLDCISNITQTLKTYPDAKVSSHRLMAILESKVELNGVNTLNNINSINVKNLSFKYDKNNILNNLNYEFERGNIYLIKGSNGTGKSTLIKLLLGLYIEDFDGEIIYNDTDIREINLYETRHKLISIVDQEPLLIHSEIYKNITYDLDVLDESLAQNLISGFNLKKDINSNNNSFSGGEKQKISIIRALLKEPDVIIMDEPTSALDLNSIYYLFEILNNIKDNKIIIIISHDDKFYKISDKILNLDSI
ncbi:ATP-binding cassette domain-containing protein [Paraclostridium dentum]|uniref:ATP-binding cassette domain-containing protein n=1 Tax=Paraclostridium dentum TaxID=2662455 RepID=UPI003B00E45F